MPTFAPSSTAAIVVAAGRGLRAGGDVPKQFTAWRGKPLIRHSVEALVRAGIARIVVVIPKDAEAIAEGALAGLDVEFVTGGATRQDSVAAGLARLTDSPVGAVLIHDAARPGLAPAVIARLLEALDASPGAVPVLAVVDSLYREGEGPVSRDALHRIQTPQAFRFADIFAAHRAWQGATDAGDDAEVARAAGLEVALVAGDEALRKVTYAADLEAAARHPRTGFGYDVHRLAAGEALWLCGVKIEHSKGLAGHSDADVALHALTDAVLGAAAAGDIGDHFPPSDPQWRGASSDRFLAHAVALAREAGYGVGHVDLTIVCEAPRIGPHKAAMRARLAQIIGIEANAVSVKATTTERLGFTGRGEGIAAQAVATLVPWD
ncbi:bifunctional 2-C-methyl-D-erythritol 4-phosphate cytidylyltransferase/2-C-methyl-D-erythritol 2,4-cyclodiphosphate synthase [Novosphingobium sp. Gsoil 351]|uniref:bifunctional 2-C-methyl-D-erythritol 4-phosphate cytidylyltransferase/2-C-methyl-D-erythritol 2,4-cyclodiphosphate synthase n=1 Tax=Novosphingobium sp. Gsoil 351 TaxID=2675225 RepID=UPI001E3834B0|nr:bifunctional 2-C-methyl-D-erythritol 4-phosphate cytidylyltransferase/2-C-methyl-D-erythritol 2,4-cyclodiphosphate synthase [Novosphingobium sp. Gsoil 351]